MFSRLAKFDMDALREPSGKVVAVAAGAGVLLIAVILWFGIRGSANNSNFPDGTLWKCTNASCGNVFTLSVHELSEHHAKHYGQPVTCPKCASEAVRAEKCPHCGSVFPAARNQTNCPVCKKPLMAPPG